MMVAKSPLPNSSFSNRNGSYPFSQLYRTQLEYWLILVLLVEPIAVLSGGNYSKICVRVTHMQVLKSEQVV